MPNLKKSGSSDVVLFSGNERTKRIHRRQCLSKVQVTVRDKKILQALAESKFLTTTMIGRLAFDGRVNSTLRLRLRRLFNNGLLKVWINGLNAENLYSLDRPAIPILRNLVSNEDASFRVPRRPERKMDHLLAINEFRISLSVSLARKQGELCSWKPDWQIKKVGEPCLVPDALFRMSLDGVRATGALEMDLGGEPVKTLFGSKLRRYCYELDREGSELNCVLVVTTTVRRLYALLTVATQERGSHDFLFTVKDRISTGDLIVPKIWTSPRLAMIQQSSDPFVSLWEFLVRDRVTVHD